MFGLGLQEILVIAFIILLLFGGKKIPEMMQGLGRGVKSFKDGMNGDLSSGSSPKESGAGKNDNADVNGGDAK